MEAYEWRRLRLKQLRKEEGKGPLKVELNAWSRKRKPKPHAWTLLSTTVLLYTKYMYLLCLLLEYILEKKICPEQGGLTNARSKMYRFTPADILPSSIVKRNFLLNLRYALSICYPQKYCCNPNSRMVSLFSFEVNGYKN